MPANLYMDVHIPRAVTEQLRRRGVDVLTAYEDNASTLDDEVLLLRATQYDRILVTQDIGLSARASNWLTEGRHFAGVVFAHQMNITIGQLVRDLEMIALASLDGEFANHILHLPL
jgi:Domain of unknown function (DUF5615)